MITSILGNKIIPFTYVPQVTLMCSAKSAENKHGRCFLHTTHHACVHRHTRGEVLALCHPHSATSSRSPQHLLGGRDFSCRPQALPLVGQETCLAASSRTGLYRWGNTTTQICVLPSFPFSTHTTETFSWLVMCFYFQIYHRKKVIIFFSSAVYSPHCSQLQRLLFTKVY